MDRREFLERAAGIATLVPGLTLLPGLTPVGFARDVHARAQAATGLHTLNLQQDAIVGCIADVLLPETDTVGARGVGVNRFIDLLLTESMLGTERDRFLVGLAAIDARSRSDYGAPLTSVGPEQQQALVRALDDHLPVSEPTPAEAAALAREPITAEGCFAWLKGLVVLAYFTAEPVARELQIQDPMIPGRYDGCAAV